MTPAGTSELRPLREVSAAGCLERWAGRPVDLLEVLLTLSFECEGPDDVLSTVARMCDVQGWAVLVANRRTAAVSFFALTEVSGVSAGDVTRTPEAQDAAWMRARRGYHQPSLMVTGMAEALLRWPSVHRALSAMWNLYRVVDGEVARDPALGVARRHDQQTGGSLLRDQEKEARRRARARLVPLYANQRVVGL